MGGFHNGHVVNLWLLCSSFSSSFFFLPFSPIPRGTDRTAIT